MHKEHGAAPAKDPIPKEMISAVPEKIKKTKAAA